MKSNFLQYVVMLRGVRIMGWLHKSFEF